MTRVLQVVTSHHESRLVGKLLVHVDVLYYLLL